MMRAEGLHKALGRLDEAIVEPARWPPSFMEDLCLQAGARGAALLRPDPGGPAVPATASIAEPLERYFTDGWYQRDPRRARSLPLHMRGHSVIIEDDILEPHDIRHSPFYNDLALPEDAPWFAAVGFRAGSSLWAMTMYRTARQGPFNQADKAILASLVPRFTEAATLSTAVGHKVLSGAIDALDLVKKPALALDRLGRVLAANASALALFDDDFRVHDKTLVVWDSTARASLADLRDRLRATPDSDALSVAPILVRRRRQAPVLTRILPITGAAQSPFLGARVLLVLSDLAARPQPPGDLLRRSFGLTAAEARLAMLLATGLDMSAAAEAIGIARETARSQLKSIFAKTDTHRQSELIALLGRL